MKFEKIASWIEEFLILILILSSVAVVFVNIVLRYLFHTGFVFVEEYARYALVLLVYLAVSQAIKKKSMIKVDIVSGVFKRGRIVFDLLSNGLSFFMGVLLIVFGIKFTYFQYTTGQVSIAMELPMYIAYAVVPLGGLLMCLRYTADTVQTIRDHFSSKTS